LVSEAAANTSSGGRDSAAAAVAPRNSASSADGSSAGDHVVSVALAPAWKTAARRHRLDQHPDGQPVSASSRAPHAHDDGRSAHIHAHQRRVRAVGLDRRHDAGERIAR
jgi:hypothetical protein